MERYQEALDNLKNLGDKDLYNERYVEWANTLQELVDILKEYNVTQSNIRKILLAGNQFEHLIEKANKYDEKETPLTTIVKTNEHYTTDRYCPVCQCFVYSFDKYCGRCGQKIRSEEVCHRN